MWDQWCDRRMGWSPRCAFVQERHCLARPPVVEHNDTRGPSGGRRGTAVPRQCGLRVGGRSHELTSTTTATDILLWRRPPRHPAARNANPAQAGRAAVPTDGGFPIVELAIYVTLAGQTLYNLAEAGRMAGQQAGSRRRLSASSSMLARSTVGEQP